jgi:DNA-binding PadR family transcriptional regulator
MRSGNRVTELEGVVLGIVRTIQPCTAYAVRGVILASPSSHWSASAGAIYPLLERLETDGLVTATLDPADGRGRRLLRLTRAGGRRHRGWMLAASSSEVASGITDAVRARVFFLSQLGARDQRLFVQGALASLDAFLSVTRRDLVARAETDGPLATLAAKGAVYQAEARVAWMKEIAEHLNVDG